MMRVETNFMRRPWILGLRGPRTAPSNEDLSHPLRQPGLARHVEVVAPGGDFVAGHLESTHAAGGDLMAVVDEAIDALGQHDVTVDRDVQKFQLRGFHALDVTFDSFANLVVPVVDTQRDVVPYGIVMEVAYYLVDVEATPRGQFSANYILGLHRTSM